MKEKLVSAGKVYKTWLQSWASFALAFVLLALMYALCFLGIMIFAKGAAKIFIWAAILSGILCLLLTIFNEPLVKYMMGAKRISQRNEAPKLWDAVDRVTPFIARPMPRIYLVQEDGMNAFAFGWGLPGFSAVGATTGIIDSLTDDELAAVMAHELGHIVSKDILVSMLMTFSVMTMAFTGWILLNGGSSSDSSKGGGIVAIILGGILYILGGKIFGPVLSMFVSRQREYGADASAAKTMGTSRPLITALEKITKNPTIGGSKACAAVGFLCTADPDPSDFMSTHPSMDKRLAALRALEG